MTRILIVDDEPNIRQIIRKYATYEDFECVEAEDGVQALDLALDQDFDIIVMDIMMPNMNGFETAKKIRAKKDTPIILLSALGEEYDRIHGFDMGVDDYVVKPFSGKELMMRIRAILKRTAGQPDDKYVCHDLIIDRKAHIVTINGERVALSPKEYDLLVMLFENRGKVITREQILSKIWGYDYFGDDRTLDTHIKLLRKNLGEYSHYLVTVRGVGYRFEKD